MQDAQHGKSSIKNIVEAAIGSGIGGVAAYAAISVWQSSWGATIAKIIGTTVAFLGFLVWYVANVEEIWFWSHCHPRATKLIKFAFISVEGGLPAILGVSGA